MIIVFPYGARFFVFPVPLCTGNTPIGLDERCRPFADHHGRGCRVAGRYLEKKSFYIFSFHFHVN